MTRSTKMTVAVSALAVATMAAAQTTIPLAQKRFDYPDGIPYQVDTDTGPRGTQQGYNRCNATTEGPESMCQTAFVNTIEDFCLWAPPEPNSVVGDTEGEMVAWCTQPGRGTRLIPEGALKGVQFTEAPDYIQVVGYIDQTQINIVAGDYGGEMDPHGADRRGNPLGGLLFSQNTGRGANATGNSTEWRQVVQWHNFMGADMFCIKACRSGERDWQFCEHIFDRIGCYYNAPADYASINGTFSSCESENQLPPGHYVVDGETRTYTQPPESLGVISTMPYQPSIPSSSMCTTYSSAELYGSLPAGSAATSAAETTAAAGATTAASAAAFTSTAAPSASRGLPANNAAARENNAAPTTGSGTGAASMGSIVSGSVVGLAAVAAGFAMLF